MLISYLSQGDDSISKSKSQQAATKNVQVIVMKYKFFKKPKALMLHPFMLFYLLIRDSHKKQCLSQQQFSPSLTTYR